MPGAAALTFTAPIQGAPLLGARIRKSAESELLGQGFIVIVVELFGSPGMPEVPAVPATDAEPEVPAVPAVPEVRHPTQFNLKISDAISDAIRANARAVDGVELFKKETPGHFSAIMGALSAGLANGTSLQKMLHVMQQFGTLPTGVAASIPD